MRLKQLNLLCMVLLGIPLTLTGQNVNFKTFNTKQINSDRSVVWQQFGPGGSGNNYYIFWHPTDPNTVFQGPNMGNLYRSTNRGNTYDGALNCDGPAQQTGKRGPMEISAVDFSRQDPNFGISTLENSNIVYTTHNKGLTWQIKPQVSAQFNNQHINTITVDPQNDNIWYAGSGRLKDRNLFVFSHEYPHGIYGSKKIIRTLAGRKAEAAKDDHIAMIWKSIDKGLTWKEITPKGINVHAQITRILIHPNNSNIVFAPTTYGLYKSTNGGKNWKLKTHTGLDNDIIRSMDMYYNKSTKKVTLFAIDLVKYIPKGKTMSFNGGVFKSTDEGESWINITNNMPLSKDLLESYTIKKGYYRLALAEWFGISEKEAMERYPILPQKMLHSISQVRVNPTNVNHLLVINNYKSQYTFPGGMLWRTDNEGSHWYVTLRNGKDWKGKDKTKWEARDNPTSHNVHWVAQKEWENRDAYDRKAGAAIGFNSDGSCIMYQAAKVVANSTDNGDSWYESDEKPTTPNGKNWVGAGNSNMPGEEIIQDLRIKDHFYLCSGENSIWRTTNDGENIRPFAQSVYKMNIPNKIHPQECSVSTMAIDPKNINTLYSLHFRQAFFGKLMKSEDAGKTWYTQGTLFNPKEFGSPVNMSIHQDYLLIDPNFTNRFYCIITRHKVVDVTNCNPGKFKAFGVYRSTDGGKHFEVINKGLPNTEYVQKISLDPHHKGAILAAVSGSKNKQGGLFRLDNNSSTWKRVNTPKDMCSVNDIYFSNDNRCYIAAGDTGGNKHQGGVWYTKDYKTWKQIFPCKDAILVRSAKYDPKVLLIDVPGDNGGKILNPGTYRSLNEGKTWSKINFGNLQSDRINDIAIDYFKKGIYWCSTYGAGYYKGIDHNIVK